MIIIDTKKCIGYEKCVKDCFLRDIEIERRGITG
ncbi:MAG: hypothetical protein K0S71_2615 [Clostridia bacterium]|jgi:hypothetical protein|nr:hypothetical protein [Clostridia bacterium]